MTPIQRLDRLERIAKLFVKAGLRARKQSREQAEKIDTLVNAHIKNEDSFARVNASLDRLAESQAETDKRIRALVETHTDTDKRLAEWKVAFNRRLAQSKAEWDRRLAKSRSDLDKQVAMWLRAQEQLAKSAAEFDKSMAALVKYVRKELK